MVIIKVTPEIKKRLEEYRDDIGCKSLNEVIELFFENEDRILNKCK